MIWTLYAKIYYLFRTALFRTVRLLILFFLITWIASEVSNPPEVKFPLFAFYLFVLWESFFRFRIAKYTPVTPLAKNDTSNIYASCTMPVLYALLTENSTKSLVKRLMEQKSSRFILYKCEITESELQDVDVPMESLLSYASQLVQSVSGTFITSMDIFIAYMLLTEEQTKLLFVKKLKPEELVHILQWARIDFPDEEHPPRLRFHFVGGGIGDALVSGWTLETKKYTNDFTYTALLRKPILMGRAGEYHQMLEGISKAENNNVLLVGDIGAGKETLVKALAYHSFAGRLGGNLDYKHFFELMVGQLIAGATDRSDLEVRVQAIVEEIAHARNIILYIPEFQNVLGAGSYNTNLSGALLPYLKNGRIPIIATVTTGDYKAYIEENPIREVFTVVKLAEPTDEIALQMLMEKTPSIEDANNVLISYNAVAAAVTYADRYLPEMVLPGSGVQLLQDASHSVAVTAGEAFGRSGRKLVIKDDIVSKLEEKTHIAVAEPKQEEKQLLLHLEDKIHERLVDQKEAVSAIAESMRRLRSGFTSSKKPVSFLFLGPTGVGKTETAKALASLYFGGEEHMIRLDMSEYSDLNGLKRLLGSSPGEGSERGELTDKVRDKPFSLILLDEFEKANPQILDLFLQVLEDGRLTDNKGHTVSFVNTIIIATSNAASEFIRENIQQGVPVDKAFQQQLLEFLQSKGLFKPELLNRFDDVITFKPLSPEDIGQITKLLLANVAKTLKEQDITVVFNQDIIDKVAREGFDAQFGARPIRRYIQNNIEDLLAQKKLRDEIPRGSVVTLSVDQQGNITAS